LPPKNEEEKVRDTLVIVVRQHTPVIRVASDTILFKKKARQEKITREEKGEEGVVIEKTPTEGKGKDPVQHCRARGKMKGILSFY